MGKQHEETLSLIHIFLTAVLDRDADALILCRDRVGERRVFYTAADGCVAFADHPDMLLEAGCLRPVIDADGLRALFGLGPARTPGRTPWRDMRALEAGCALVARGNDVRVRRYFHLEAREHEDDAAATVCLLYTSALGQRTGQTPLAHSAPPMSSSVSSCSYLEISEGLKGRIFWRRASYSSSVMAS